jgi:hypothetical protein
MTGISLHKQWPLTSQLHGSVSQREQLVFFCYGSNSMLLHFSYFYNSNVFTFPLYNNIFVNIFSRLANSGARISWGVFFLKASSCLCNEFATMKKWRQGAKLVPTRELKKLASEVSFLNTRRRQLRAYIHRRENPFIKTALWRPLCVFKKNSPQVRELSLSEVSYDIVAKSSGGLANPDNDHSANQEPVL